MMRRTKPFHAVDGDLVRGNPALVALVVPYTIATVRAGAFTKCKQLKSIELGANVTTIGASAFSGCAQLVSVKLGPSVTEIGDKAFENCVRLTTISIPDTVQWMGWDVFRGCTKLQTVTVGNRVIGCSNALVGHSSSDIYSSSGCPP